MDILLVVDMQNDFVTGPLGTPEAIAIVDNIKNKIKESHLYTLFTRDTHYQDYLQTQEGKKLPIKHCIYETPGWCLIDGLIENAIFYKIINKESFGYLDFSKIINDIYKDPRLGSSIHNIYIVGVCTDICVISNALILKSLFPEKRIIVDASCCAGTTPEMHRKALDIMKSCQIDVINDDIEN